jgi:CheY-like chemotaxis protein
VSAQQLNNVRRKVLVIDDDPTFRELLTDLLEMVGYDVWSAQDGLAGLDILYNGPFDLILTDYRMPGMTGVEVAAFIRKSDTVTPVILITGDSSVLDLEIVARAGITRVLPKPLKINEFLNICAIESKKEEVSAISTTRQKEAGQMSGVMSKGIALGVLVLALTTGCAGMSTRQQRALSGGAIGAAGGAVLGATVGSPVTGAVVGGAVGTATGAMWDDIKKSLK